MDPELCASFRPDLSQGLVQLPYLGILTGSSGRYSHIRQDLMQIKERFGFGVRDQYRIPNVNATSCVLIFLVGA